MLEVEGCRLGPPPHDLAVGPRQPIPKVYCVQDSGRDLALTIPLLFLSIIEKQKRVLSSLDCSFCPTAYAAIRYSRKLTFLSRLRSSMRTIKPTCVSAGSSWTALATSVVSNAMSQFASKALKFYTRARQAFIPSDLSTILVVQGRSDGSDAR
jgi:hypothetical protein